MANFKVNEAIIKFYKIQADRNLNDLSDLTRRVNKAIEDIELAHEKVSNKHGHKSKTEIIACALFVAAGTLGVLGSNPAPGNPIDTITKIANWAQSSMQMIGAGNKGINSLHDSKLSKNQGTEDSLKALVETLKTSKSLLENSQRTMHDTTSQILSR